MYKNYLPTLSGCDSISRWKIVKNMSGNPFWSWNSRLNFIYYTIHERIVNHKWTVFLLNINFTAFGPWNFNFRKSQLQ